MMKVINLRIHSKSLSEKDSKKLEKNLKNIKITFSFFLLEKRWPTVVILRESITLKECALIATIVMGEQRNHGFVHTTNSMLVDSARIATSINTIK